MEAKINFSQATTNIQTHLTMTNNAHDFLLWPKESPSLSGYNNTFISNRLKDYSSVLNSSIHRLKVTWWYVTNFSYTHTSTLFATIWIKYIRLIRTMTGLVQLQLCFMSSMTPMLYFAINMNVSCRWNYCAHQR